MGCDIHLWAERRVDGAWQYASDNIYDQRNYRTFAILAAVRNDHDMTPISEPRGLPEDCGDYVREELSNDGGHSASHLTVAEIMAFDWTQMAHMSGWLNGLGYWLWSGYQCKERRPPDGWCGSVVGGGIEHIGEAEMERRIADISKRNSNPRQEIAESLSHIYCCARWETPYYMLSGCFLSEAMPKLWRLGKPGDVRIIFFFDN